MEGTTNRDRGKTHSLNVPSNSKHNGEIVKENTNGGRTHSLNVQSAQ